MRHTDITDTDTTPRLRSSQGRLGQRSLVSVVSVVSVCRLCRERDFSAITFDAHTTPVGDASRVGCVKCRCIGNGILADHPRCGRLKLSGVPRLCEPCGFTADRRTTPQRFCSCEIELPIRTAVARFARPRHHRHRHNPPPLRVNAALVAGTGAWFTASPPSCPSRRASSPCRG